MAERIAGRVAARLGIAASGWPEFEAFLEALDEQIRNKGVGD